ncbi:MAG: hypothetical protein ACPGK1_16105, partial [bacterium]
SSTEFTITLMVSPGLVVAVSSRGIDMERSFWGEKIESLATLTEKSADVQLFWAAWSASLGELIE